MRKQEAAALLRRRSSVAETSPPLSELLRGTLRRRFIRCGKAGCHCKKSRGHGPFIYLSVALGLGRTHQITVVPEAYPLAKRYVENYRRLWRLIEEVSRINRSLLQRRLLGPARPRVRRIRQGPA